ncbi:SMP-30/gluconolactonase/LRE family protein [Pararobbsia silviterrae]|uniref:SMP-30/gluconolactonase/LRE family protein n=1 Tax=Pararobbsia silviterrae TaxID=1792498 RepID=A0A494XME1_9BURK|nr:SMP-30/gluconolactonase/LRE family protein [Pararobbsia silviterrae]RKP51857.1 SMP-30/gluconolactonase/LRE family protein [Pararobbsia silviterrae]
MVLNEAGHRIQIVDASLSVAVDAGNHHGEGVFWNPEDGLLWWTDIESKLLWSLNPVTRESKRHAMPERICCFAPRSGGGFVLGAASGFVAWDPRIASWDPIVAFESDLPQTRLNDGRTDRAGRLVAGGMDERDGKPVSSVCRLEADFSVTPLFTGVACANSICFSPDGSTMYFADSATRRVEAFDYDTLDARRTLYELEEGSGLPDGSCVDAEGYVWNAVWNGSRVERRAPDGTLDRVIPMPTIKPTCCAFGGEQLDTLFITTSRLQSSAEQLARDPLAGALFAIRPGVRGLADPSFAG